MPKLIAPSILSADFANLGEEIQKVSQAGADWIHVDVMDGHFVPNLTIGPPVVAALKKVSKLPLDVHLMIENPERWIGDYAKAGADWLTVHFEAVQDASKALQMIRDQGMKSGITLRPGTPVSAVLPFLKLADLVLVMSVEPGFGGQSFMPDQVTKIETLRKEILAQKLNTLIEVDGGINDSTAAQCKAADVLVAGHYIFRNPAGYSAAIQKLRAALLGR